MSPLKPSAPVAVPAASETGTEEPAAQAGAVVGTRAMEGIHDAAVDMATEPPRAMMNPTLPPGWSEVATAEGEVYYWCEETDETSWEFPHMVTTNV